MPNTKGWEAIKAKADELGWPTHYKSDLAIDYNVLMRPDAPKVFGWAIRETGTDLFTSRGALEWLKTTRYSNRRFFYYNGYRLIEFTGEELVKIVSHFPNEPLTKLSWARNLSLVRQKDIQYWLTK